VSVRSQAGSPLNKIIGVGYDGLPDEAALSALERAWWAHDQSVRFEISTLADPGFHTYLSGRGYRVDSFEHVLVQPLPGPVVAVAPDVVIERVRADTLEAWLAASLAGFGNLDGSVPARQPRQSDVLAGIFRDFAHTDGLVNYLAYVDGAVAGAAGARFDDDRLVYLVGASTVPAYRRRGVQRAVLAARLAEAAAAGCELAVVTTAPGSQSQANAMRAGFTLGYARAVMVRSPA
jgi:ribosomal protein S18 acetylase RimI-like enzyme